MSEKIKILAYCDSPTCATGFGTVSRNIFEALHRTGKYEIDILGINYWGDPHEFPYRIWPTGTNQDRDPYGRKKVCNMIPKMDFDILFFLQDTFILDFLPELMLHLKQNRDKPFKSICYFPIDGTPKEQWIKNVSAVDYPVAYTEFGKNEAKKAFDIIENIDVIPHGSNVQEYFVLDQKELLPFKQQYFGRHAEKFIITNLNRNQQRKDIPRTIQVFSEFRKQVPESILYLHMAQQDQGWNLPEVCKAYGLNTSDDVIFPENFGPNQGYPRNIVNALYNCSDVVVSTCLGEGWGLSWSEAMATKTPVIMPKNTAMADVITEERGYLVDSGTNSSLFTVLPHDNEIIRPLVDVDDMVDKLLQVYNNREEAARRAQNACEWVNGDLNWQGAVADIWVNKFGSVYGELTNEKQDVQSILDNLGTEKVLETESF